MSLTKTLVGRLKKNESAYYTGEVFCTAFKDTNIVRGELISDTGRIITISTKCKEFDEIRKAFGSIIGKVTLNGVSQSNDHMKLLSDLTILLMKDRELPESVYEDYPVVKVRGMDGVYMFLSLLHTAFPESLPAVDDGWCHGKSNIHILKSVQFGVVTNGYISKRIVHHNLYSKLRSILDNSSYQSIFRIAFGESMRAVFIVLLGDTNVIDEWCRKKPNELSEALFTSMFDLILNKISNPKTLLQSASHLRLCDYLRHVGKVFLGQQIEVFEENIGIPYANRRISDPDHLEMAKSILKKKDQVKLPNGKAITTFMSKAISRVCAMSLEGIVVSSFDADGDNYSDLRVNVVIEDAGQKITHSILCKRCETTRSLVPERIFGQEVVISHTYSKDDVIKESLIPVEANVSAKCYCKSVVSDKSYNTRATLYVTKDPVDITIEYAIGTANNAEHIIDRSQARGVFINLCGKDEDVMILSIPDNDPDIERIVLCSRLIQNTVSRRLSDVVTRALIEVVKKV